jgi:HNH endonuclease
VGRRATPYSSQGAAGVCESSTPVRQAALLKTFAQHGRTADLERLEDRCEYCQLPAQLQGGGFEVDHILPRSRGGRTGMVNVALACLHCNAHKWAYSDGEDPVSGQRVAPFNPRTQRWEEHLQWSVHRWFAIVGISTHGRTTVARLQMSHPNLVSIRCLLAALGISWKVEAYRDRGSLGHHFCCKNRFESFDHTGC